MSIPPVTAVTRCLQRGRAATSARTSSRLAGAGRLASTRLAGGRLAGTRLAGAQFRRACAAGLAAAMAAPASGRGWLAGVARRRALRRPGLSIAGRRLVALARADARP